MLKFKYKELGPVEGEQNYKYSQPINVTIEIIITFFFPQRGPTSEQFWIKLCKRMGK